MDRTSDNRTGQDRRRQGLPSLRALLFHPRRRTVRRATDRRRIVLLDSYHASMFLPIVMVLVLSTTDALLTLVLLSHGASEVNPVMAYFIEKGPVVFMTVKYLLTSISVMIVVILNYMFIPVLRMHMRDLLNVFATLFGAVIVWEVYLFFQYVL